MDSRVEQVEQFCNDLRSLARADARDAGQDLELELRRILESDHFRGSKRSCRFLQHVVQKALANDFDALKERVLGVELFGRDSDFDTDHDAIVRVTANDVRKRLKEHYRENPDHRLRIGLPAGLYIPRIELLPEETLDSGHAVADQKPDSAHFGTSGRLPVFWIKASLMCLLPLISVPLLWKTWHGPPIPATPSAVDLPPWSILLKPGRTLNIVPADANLVATKVRSGRDVSIEQYSGRAFTYAPDLPGQFGQYLNRIPLTTVADAFLVGRISELAARSGIRSHVKYCNRLDFSDLKREEPMVLLGSPTSNPWVQLLYEQLNFQVVHRFEDGYDVCVNRRPQAGELKIYVPAVKRAAISEGYAIVALVPNLTGKAPVLIIAGTSTAGTEAAGDFVTNLDQLSDSLRKLGLQHLRPPSHWELLIKTSFVAAASTSYEIVAHRAY